jgi:hypothetical protein
MSGREVFVVKLYGSSMEMFDEENSPNLALYKIRFLEDIWTIKKHSTFPIRNFP